MSTYAPAAKNAAIHAGQGFLKSFGDYDNEHENEINQHDDGQPINNNPHNIRRILAPQQQQQQQQLQSRQYLNKSQLQNPNNGNTYRSEHTSNQNYSTRYNDGNGENEAQGQRSLSLEYGKTIKLLKNGDEFYRGHRCVINSRKYRYLDVFLDDISDKNFGAVRSIHTPVHGHKIKNLDEIENGKTYVAAANGRFIKLKFDSFFILYYIINSVFF